jgi:hypothetical protein
VSCSWVCHQGHHRTTELARAVDDGAGSIFVVMEGWRAEGVDTSCVGAVKHHRCTLVASETDFWLFWGIIMLQTFFRTCVDISFCNFLSQKSL